MANWNQTEVLGNQYVYVSKNGNDTLAANFFGKAAAWSSSSIYAINDKVTYSSIQYYNKTGINTVVAPSTDTTNWGFDHSNFCTYNTSHVYNVGEKAVSSGEHYICNVSGSTGTFQTNNWTKVIVSNKDVPYLYLNTVIALINGDSRFVSYELLDYPNNKAYHKIHVLLSNGVWSETLGNVPSKYTRFVGQSKWKTRLITDNTLNGYGFHDTIGHEGGTTISTSFKFNNCICFGIVYKGANPGPTFFFNYKTIFLQGFTQTQYTFTYYHIVNCVFLGNNPQTSITTTYFANTIIKNNYFADYFWVSSVFTNLQAGAMDYNYFCKGVYVAGVLKSSIADIRTAIPNQNLNSYYNTTPLTLNSDYSLPTNSPLLSVGANGVNIGAENRGYNYTTSTLMDSSSGAVYRNVIKVLNVLVREQVNKFPQAATSSNITLQSDASSVDETYTGFRIKIIDGLGINQTRLITAYNGTTKVATIGAYSGSSSTWDITPDQYSIYEILDGEVISAIGDLGVVKNIKNFTFLSNNIYDIFGKYQQFTSYDNLDDGPDSLNFYLRSGMGGTGSTWRRFNQDGQLLIDTSGRGSGDVGFDANNITTTTLPMRYFQIKIQLHKN